MYEHLLACIYLYQVCACLVPGRRQKPEEDIRSLGTGVADSCEPPCAGLKFTLGPLNQLSSSPCALVTPALEVEKDDLQEPVGQTDSLAELVSPRLSERVFHRNSERYRGQLMMTSGLHTCPHVHRLT